MALTVEDGTKVTGSDTYVSRADFIAYAAKQGVTVADEGASDVYLIKAAEFIEAHDPMLKGERATRDQSMCYPRADLVLNNFTWDSNEIPTQVIKLQQELALDLIAGIDIWNPPQSGSQGVKKEEVVGAVVVEYATADGSKLTRQSNSRALLGQLLQNSGVLSTPIRMG